MCPKDLERKISKEVGAVIIVHIGGLISPNIIKIIEICKKFNIPLVEDAAQAQGSHYKNIYAGNFGIAGAFSFYTTKVMTTGEGGMITTNNIEFYKKCFSLRQFGMDINNNILHNEISSNFKLSEFSALLGLLELKRVKKRIDKRNKISKKYYSILNKNKNFNLLTSNGDFFCNYYKQIIISKIKRSKIESIFKKKKISLTGGVYYSPLHKQPIYKKILSKYNLKITDYFCDNHFCPPCYPELSFKQIKKIANILNNI